MNTQALNVADVQWIIPNFKNIPEELKPQPWAVWKAEPKKNRPGKYNKAPRNPASGIKIGADKPELFGTFEEAKAAYERGGYTGIGVLLTANGIVGVDIDNYQSTLKEQSKVKTWVAQVIDAGAYVEYSPSGTGLRLFMRGKLPGTGRNHKPLEIYDDVRFLTVTGAVLSIKKSGA